MTSMDISNIKVTEAIAYSLYKASGSFDADTWRIDPEVREIHRQKASVFISDLAEAGVKQSVQRAKLDGFVRDIATRPAEVVYSLDEEVII